MNTLILSGRIGKGGTTVREHNGGTFLTLDLAEDTGYRAKDGTWETSVQWHKAVVYGGSEIMARNMPQGRMVYLTGTLRLREYTTAAGERRVEAQCKVDLAHGGRVEFGARAAHVAGDDAPVDMGDALPDESLQDPVTPATDRVDAVAERIKALEAAKARRGGPLVL